MKAKSVVCRIAKTQYQEGFEDCLFLIVTVSDLLKSQVIFISVHRSFDHFILLFAIHSFSLSHSYWSYYNTVL